MKTRKNKLLILGVGGILLMFIVSLLLPALRMAAKAGALLIYAGVNYVQIKELKKQGEDIQKPVLFTAAVLIIIGYLLFFA